MKTLLIASVFIIAACTDDTALRYYSEEKYPPKQVEEVIVYRSKPSNPFITLADFQSRWKSEEGLKKLAAEIGADAIIVSNIGGYYSTDEQWASEDRYKDSSSSRIIATAIKFK